MAHLWVEGSHIYVLVGISVSYFLIVLSLAQMSRFFTLELF